MLVDQCLHIENSMNEGLWNYIQHFMIPYTGKESDIYVCIHIYINIYLVYQILDIYIYMTESLCCTLKLTQHCRSTILQFKKRFMDPVLRKVSLFMGNEFPLSHFSRRGDLLSSTPYVRPSHLSLTSSAGWNSYIPTCCLGSVGHNLSLDGRVKIG